ncbi:MAG: glycosyltransferase [Pirellulaceae bacterium]|nr:glycosyltransferase [Pirellulaceae bacterium]
MSDSLSIIVPVRNVQSSLAAQVDRLLDLLTDLTADFQVILVDDGSTDATAEVADELSRQFPQVTSVLSGRGRGEQSASAAGLRHATGRFVFVHPPQEQLASEQLARFWKLRDQPGPRPKRAQRADSAAFPAYGSPQDRSLQELYR